MNFLERTTTSVCYPDTICKYLASWVGISASFFKAYNLLRIRFMLISAGFPINDEQCKCYIETRKLVLEKYFLKVKSVRYNVVVARVSFAAGHTKIFLFCRRKTLSGKAVVVVTLRNLSFQVFFCFFELTHYSKNITLPASFFINKTCFLKVVDIISPSGVVGKKCFFLSTRRFRIFSQGFETQAKIYQKFRCIFSKKADSSPIPKPWFSTSLSTYNYVR